MGVIVLEGLVVTLLVIVGFREAVMNAVPLALKKAIGAGIGLFILFIGFVGGGFIATPQGGTPIVAPVFPTTPGQFLFLGGLLFTIVLFVRKIPGALIISIFVITVVALLTGIAKVPETISVTPSFATLGQFDLTNVFTVLGPLAAVLTIFAIMLTDFFDTMGTVTGVASEAGLAEEDGSVPGVGRVLLVDSLAAVAGGAAGVSSNTTFIESAAGVAEGGRTGLRLDRDRRSCSCSRSSCRRWRRSSRPRRPRRPWSSSATSCSPSSRASTSATSRTASRPC